jgi:hypothetical protein
MNEAQQLTLLTVVSAALFVGLAVRNRKQLSTLLPAFTPRAFVQVLGYVTRKALPEALFNPAPNLPKAAKKTHR